MADASISEAMNQRPLSPHLQVYKLGFAMVLSGLHRITGMAATVGFFLFAWWLMALASGPGAYVTAMRVVSSPLGKLVLAGFTFSFIYHLCNGIRHMLWDTGRMFERPQIRRSGLFMLVSALLLTGLVLWLGCLALARGAP